MSICAGQRLGPHPRNRGPVANKQDSRLAHVAHDGPNTLGHPLTCTNTTLAHHWATFLAQPVITPHLTCGYALGPDGPPTGCARIRGRTHTPTREGRHQLDPTQQPQEGQPHENPRY